MRKTINPQPNLREPWLELEHARELETISSLLDAHPKLNELVLQDLRSVTPPAGSDVGRGGMSAEQVLRALLVKQLNQFTYRELAFHLADSRSYRTFCQLGIIEPTPSKSTLAANIKAVKFETLEQINRELVSVAEDAGIEKGRKVRVDCTVVESNIHPPTDSELLYDCVRVLTRVMCRARELLGTVVVFGNRTRRAKRRRLGVLNAKDKQQRRGVYRDLLKVTEETYRSAQRVAAQLEESGLTEPVKRASAERIAADFEHFLVLTKKVINQTQRRVIDEERVPAEEKGRFYLRRTHRHYSQRPARDSLRPQGVYDWWLVLDDFGLRDLGWESVRFNSRGNHDRPSSRTLRTGPAPGCLRWRVFFKGKLGSHQRQGS